jgi:hypothetical protein
VGAGRTKAASKGKLNESFCQPMHVIFAFRLGVVSDDFPRPPNQLGSHHLGHNSNTCQGVLVVGLGTPSFEKALVRSGPHRCELVLKKSLDTFRPSLLGLW